MTRLYAIGDVHGQYDALSAAHARIAADRRRCGDWAAPVVHLGDLCDRGPDSAGVIRFLMAGPVAGGAWHCLFGNHDRMFLQFLQDPARQDSRLNPAYTWLHPKLGGMDTLQSFGVAPADPAAMRAEALVRVPQALRDWLAARPRLLAFAGVVCVHAGLRPGVALSNQHEDDLVWIREPFLSDRRDHGALVVHGHTVVPAPDHRGNRVNLDTGAGYGAPLTAAVIEDGQVAILTDHGREPLLPP